MLFQWVGEDEGRQQTPVEPPPPFVNRAELGGFTQTRIFRQSGLD
jgi:hypothetical protein